MSDQREAKITFEVVQTLIFAADDEDAALKMDERLMIGGTPNCDSVQVKVVNAEAKKHIKELVEDYSL